MRCVIPGAVACLFFLALTAPVLAGGIKGKVSVGLGGGFGDNSVGPFVMSGKYWTRNWEAGGEVFYDGNTQNAIDQFGLLWGLYRVDLNPEPGNYLYLGAGPGTQIKAKLFKNSVGEMVAVGWDGRHYGLEFKYGYFAPSIYSVVAYWHF